MAGNKLNFPEYSFADHSIGIDGLQMHYVDEGPRDGAPVLMVHGNPTWSFYYRRLISALSSRYRVIAPDHIGMGLSERPDESRYDFTLARRVSDLEALVDSLELRQPLTLVVHDWGGMIGMAWASRHPERVARIIVLNTGAFTLPKSKAMPWQLTLARTPVVGALLVRGLNAFSRGAVKDCVMRPLSPEAARGYLAPYDSWFNRLAVHRFIQDIPLKPGDRAWDIVAGVEENLLQFRHVPMLICWGMKDFVFDEHFLNRWIELFPKAGVHRFDNAGHYVLEDAHEQIIPLVQQFLGARLPMEVVTP
ncbi:MAG TPA: alpha/beta fold hydrolase [Phycisphaerae bacterium]|nr:alpha/beta fold hydrolase [Phycisphaerae bacterium]